MRRLFCAVVMVLGVLSSQAMARANGGDVLAVQDLVLTVPDGWQLHQNAKDNGKMILGFKGVENNYTTMFVVEGSGVDMKSVFVNGSDIVEDVRQISHNGYFWNRLDTSKDFNSSTYYVASFLLEKDGYTYYGYSKSQSQEDAQRQTRILLDSLK